MSRRALLVHALRTLVDQVESGENASVALEVLSRLANVARFARWRREGDPHLEADLRLIVDDYDDNDLLADGRAVWASIESLPEDVEEDVG